MMSLSFSYVIKEADLMLLDVAYGTSSCVLQPHAFFKSNKIFPHKLTFLLHNTCFWKIFNVGSVESDIFYQTAKK